MNTDDEKRLFYLLSGTFDVLPPSYIKLRSYLGIHCAKIAEDNNLTIFNSRQTCPICFSTWTCDTSSFKLLPSKKIKKSRKKIRAKSGEKGTSRELKNLLVLKCKVCTQRSYFPLVKKKIVKETVQEEIIVKKKRRKKDKTCGLRIPLNNSAQAKKKKGSGGGKGAKNPAKAQTKAPVTPPTPKTKPPPVAKSKETISKTISHPQHQKNLKKAQQNLKKLKQAVKANKEISKTSIKSFMNLFKSN